MSYWGYHAMFDCAACDTDKITSKENVHAFIKELVLMHPIKQALVFFR